MKNEYFSRLSSTYCDTHHKKDRNVSLANNLLEPKVVYDISSNQATVFEYICYLNI